MGNTSKWYSFPFQTVQVNNHPLLLHFIADRNANTGRPTLVVFWYHYYVVHIQDVYKSCKTSVRHGTTDKILDSIASWRGQLLARGLMALELGLWPDMISHINCKVVEEVTCSRKKTQLYTDHVFFCFFVLFTNSITGCCPWETELCFKVACLRGLFT